jgi:hypothetical protein
MADLVRRPQSGDPVRWGAVHWRIRGLIVAPAPSVVLGIIGRRDSLRVDPDLWSRATWSEVGKCWRLPDEEPRPAA